MKNILLIIFLFCTLIIFSNTSNIELYKKEILQQNDKVQLFNLLSLPIGILRSGTRRYYYIFSLSNFKSKYGDSLPIPKTIKIDNIIFNKGEINWFFVYDSEKKEIIQKDYNIHPGSFNGCGEFNDEKEFIIFNVGTSHIRKFYFYDLRNNKPPIILPVFSGGVRYKKKDYLISDNREFITCLSPLNQSQEIGYPETYILIKSLITNKDYKLIPDEKNHTFLINYWLNNKTLVYSKIYEWGSINKEKVVNDDLQYIINN